MKPQVQRTSSAPTLRAIALGAVWALMTVIAILHQYRGGGPHGAPTVDALCPMGGLATLYKVLADGEYLQRVFPSAVILLVATVLLVILFRRVFCGWICPLGAMQEFFAFIGRRAGWHRSLHGSKLDAGLRPLKYVVLVAILALTWHTGQLVFRPYDPWTSYAHVSAGWGELTDEFPIGSIILVLLLVGSLVVERTYCRYLCPFGAFLGAISRRGIVRVVRNDHTCIHCHRCDAVCPVDIPVEALPQVTTGECLSCGKCVNACPIPSALNLEAYRGRLRPSVAGITALAIFFGVILLTKVSGGWKSLPATMSEITGVGSTLDPANIRGFMSLKDIEAAYGVSAAGLRDHLQLPGDTGLGVPVRTIMPRVGRDVEEVRQATAELLVADSANSPDGAAGEASPEETQPHSGPLPPGHPTEAEPEYKHPDTSAITGSMTLADIEERYELTTRMLLGELGLPPETSATIPLKDILRPLGREVEEVRRAVAEMLRRQDDTPHNMEQQHNAPAAASQ